MDRDREAPDGRRGAAPPPAPPPLQLPGPGHPPRRPADPRPRARALAAAVVTACMIAGCSLIGSTAPSKPPTPVVDPNAPAPTPTISIAQLAKDYLVVAGDSNDAHAELRAHCSGNLTLKQQRDCYAREAVIEENLLKAYSELKVPPELEADFAALRA